MVAASWGDDGFVEIVVPVLCLARARLRPPVLGGNYIFDCLNNEEVLLNLRRPMNWEFYSLKC